jgi:two-component system, LytTR family, response regulator
MRLNCIIVDDSTLQRTLVSKLVSENINLELIGEFSNAFDTKICFSANKIDLIFLDIEMPVINGFNLLDGLTQKPQIIFITAKAEYALKAFDYDATDYIQKPITKERFNAAVKRAVTLHELKNETQDEEKEHIYVKSNLKNLKIYTNKIKWVEAFGDYVKIVTDENESHLVLSTMKAFEELLNKEKFIRVHKSFIINTDKVERYNSKFVEIGTNQIPLSRHKKEDLSKMVNS